MDRAEPVPAEIVPAGFFQRAVAVLEEVFGFDGFRPGQQRAIEAIARGRDCLVIMPTGSGKSLCFQLTAHHYSNEGLTLVVSPLIALMTDQTKKNRTGEAILNSTLDTAAREACLQNVRKARFSLLFVTPEQLQNESGDIDGRVEFRIEIADVLFRIILDELGFVDTGTCCIPGFSGL